MDSHEDGLGIANLAPEPTRLPVTFKRDLPPPLNICVLTVFLYL